ncbi:Retroviral aspartyl protease [Popillia japonica]|uniref:Retroviral aspartyl protease n=1 Tax=Popillia japonica TaxID=7064 RepID=A0AAW1JET5_POPJA
MNTIETYQVKSMVSKLGSVNYKSKSLSVTLSIEDKNVDMEVDTGATVSIMSVSEFKHKFPSSVISNSSVKLKAVTGNCLNVVGEVTVKVKHNDKIVNLPLILVSNKHPFKALLGR